MAGGAGLGGGGISDQSDAIPSVLQRNSKAPASPSPPTLPRWCCFKYGSAGLNAEPGDLLQNPRKGGKWGMERQNLKVQRLLFPDQTATGRNFFLSVFLSLASNSPKRRCKYCDIFRQLDGWGKNHLSLLIAEFPLPAASLASEHSLLPNTVARVSDECTVKGILSF